MKRTLLLGALALVSALGIAAAADAAIGITASPASVTAPAVTLSGDDQTTTWSVTLTISSVTKALGYNVTAWAPLPASGSSTLGGLTVDSAPTLSCTQGGCTTGTHSVTTYPVALGTTSGTAAKILGATVNTANKNQQAVVAFTVPVTADELPGTYTTTVTLIAADGP